MNTQQQTTRLLEARNKRDEALLRGNLFSYLMAERCLKQEQNRKANDRPHHKQIKQAKEPWFFRPRKVVVAGDVIQIVLMDGNHSRVLTTSLEENFGQLAYRYNLCTRSIWYSCGTKPVDLDIALREYVVSTHTFVAHHRCMGGSTIGYRDLQADIDGAEPITWETVAELWNGGTMSAPFTLLPELTSQRRLRGRPLPKVEVDRTSRKCDHTPLALKSRRRGRSQRFEVQAMSSSDWNWLMDVINRATKNFDRQVVKQIELVFILVGELYNARNWGSVKFAILGYLSHFCEGSLSMVLIEKLSTLLGNCVQADDGAEDEDDTWDVSALKGIRNFRSFLANWDSIQGSVYGQKFAKILKYLSAFGMFSFMGIKPCKEMYYTLAENVNTPWGKLNFVGALIDFLTLTAERCIILIRTGDWNVFLHGEHSYQKWYDEAQRLRRLSLTIGNLEAFGTTYFSYVADIKQCIEQGKGICKFGGLIGAEQRIARSTLNDIELLQMNILSTKAAQQERSAPFGLLVFGDSSVGKSTFTKILFYHYGKLRNLPVSSEYRYVRNASDDYWSGFNSQQWCIQMDDIGYLNASKAMEDRSLMEIIQVINNVPLVPNQAALEDKGRTPVRAKLVIATSNAKDLNAAAYFHCPLAVQRRLPFVVTVTPKAEYARSDSPGMVDPLKIPEFVDSYPDIWNIKVERVVAAGKGANGRSMAAHELVVEFTDINEFLDWYRDTIISFEQIQMKAMRDDDHMKNFELCSTCSRVTKHCKCQAVQASGAYFVLPYEYEVGDSYLYMGDESEGHTIYWYTWAAHLGKYVCLETETHTGVAVKKRAYPVEMRRPSKHRTVTSDELMPVMADMIQAQVDSRGRAERLVGKALIFGISLYHRSSCVRWLVDRLFSFHCVRRGGAFLIERAARNHATVRKIFAFSDAVRCHVTHHHVVYKVLAALAATATVFQIVRPLLPEKKVKEEPVEVVHCEQPAPEVGVSDSETQGNIAARLPVSASFFPKSESENVWKRDNYETTTFDTQPAQLNYAALTVEQVAKSLSRNVVRVDVSSENHTMRGHALCVGGHLWVVPKHFFKEVVDTYEVTLNFEAPVEGANRNVTFTLFRKDALFRDDKDQVWFEARCVEVKRDITGLIAKDTLDGSFEGCLLSKQRNTKENFQKARAILRVEMQNPLTGEYEMMWRAEYPTDTIKGDCGAPLLAHTPVSAILGLHFMGGASNLGFCIPLTQGDVVRARTRFTRPLIQAACPMLNASTTNKILGKLHHKSPVRFLETGNITVYGSFEGAHLKPRSKVRNTLLSEQIQQERGWILDVGAPELSDWRPWRHAYVDVVNHKHNVSYQDIDVCVKAYVNDVVSKLSPEAKATIQRLSRYDAINGIAGVKYIDKMNFNTSMGEPFNHSKKFHLSSQPQESAPEGKIFDAEVMDRVDKIVKDFEAGFRTCSIYSGQLKDEPRSLKKLADGKIRVFTACATDFAVAMREFLLPFVKVFQENPFIFEGAPGAVCQSKQWDEFRKYLTQHGNDRCIAGDFQAYDKGMTSPWILGAFQVIAEICEACGWTPEEVLPIFAMAEDVAFPIVNMNGDLVQFNGSDPSGQPLTVIVNCIVNSLYMRYCYLKTEREQLAKQQPFVPDTPAFNMNILSYFQCRVALLTYGDDNALNVSKKVPHFNHTSISKVLATINVKYTMADKESESVPYIHINDVSFLKRKWVWNAEAGAHFCPLEEASIRKMLMIATRSRTISDQAHMASVMRSANDEWFWYGKERFLAEQQYLLTLAQHPEVRAYFRMFPLQTWEQLMERFHKASQHLNKYVPRAQLPTWAA